MEAGSPSKQQIREREERWAKPAAVAALLGVVLAIGSVIAVSQILTAGSDAQTLRDVVDKSSAVLALAISRAIGFGLIAVPLLYLFKAAQARGQGLAEIVASVAVVAVVMLSLGSVLNYVGIHNAASDFTSQHVAPADAESAANDAIDNVGTVGDFGAYLSFAGQLLLGLFGLFTSLWAMRAGLLTRFWGTFGMATGALFFALPYFYFGFIIYLGFLIGGWVPGGRPPAWPGVEAIPWPKGNRQLHDTVPESPAVEGSGREIGSADEPDAGSAAADGPVGAQGLSLEETEQRRRDR